MENLEQRETFDLTPTPQLLQLLGDLKFKGWQCIAELIDNSIDAIINSSSLNPSQKKIIVTIPTAAKIKSNEPLLIEDYAQGMTEQQLENAVRAGFSSKNTKNNIGLFGMGFNVATACLANTVEVWTSTEEMEKEIGVRIDLTEMALSKSFYRPKLSRSKPLGKISGTEIKIYDYKNNSESLLKIRDIVDNISRAYTTRIFNELGISIKINQHDIRPFNFCTWSDKVSVKVKYEDIPAYYEVDEVLKEELFCENCFNWLGTNVNTALSVECQFCRMSGTSVKKEVHLVGWVGIQRYPDPSHYGIDVSRNGRILKKLDKSFFFWNDERGKDDQRFQPEYPRDNPLYNGRIVGQIEANFIVPKYTKDDFESDDANWKLAVNFLRGEMPLQTDLGEMFGYKGLNKSPIGNLFRAYRRIDPPGKKTLMFAKADQKSDPLRQKNWATKFYEGDADFIDEKKWLDEIEKSELKENNSTFNLLNPLATPQNSNNNNRITSPTQIKVKSPDEEKFPGKQLLKRTLTIDLQKVLHEKLMELTLVDYFPEKELAVPIIFEPIGPMKFKVYLNNSHPIFRDFAEGYEELIYMEVAAKYSMLKNHEDWPVNRIYYELKSKYASETMLSVPGLVAKANSLMREIQNKLLFAEGFTLTKTINLNENEIKAIKAKYIELESKNLNQLETLLSTTKFLSYLDLNYMFKFIEEFPELIFDGKVLDLPYQEIEDEEIRRNELHKYLGFFRDVRWFMNDLASQGDEAIRKLKQQIIRNRISIEILYGRITK